jgi:hypothetical protein
VGRPNLPERPLISEREHIPSRPSWNCAACDRPWPDLAREDMARRYGGSALPIHAATYLEEASRDMPHAPLAALYERFLAWTRLTSR